MSSISHTAPPGVYVTGLSPQEMVAMDSIADLIKTVTGTDTDRIVALVSASDYFSRPILSSDAITNVCSTESDI